MNTFLWVVQGFLALVFLLSGVLKSTMSKQRLAAMGQTGVAPYPLPFIRFIAASEIFGAGGIIFPSALHIDSFLTPMAALGLSIIMVGAAATHWRLKEPLNVTTNMVLLLLCLFVAWSRA